MVQFRRADERGHVRTGWLDSRTFRFGSYRDPRFMGYGPLRVIKEGRVDPARVFREGLEAGDGAALVDRPTLTLVAHPDAGLAEALVFDLL